VNQPASGYTNKSNFQSGRKRSFGS